jgi:hypothetical protein
VLAALLGDRNEKDFGVGGRKWCEVGRRRSVEDFCSITCAFTRPLIDVGPVTFGARCYYVVAISD